MGSIIDKNNPFWYRVLISSNIDKSSLAPDNQFILTVQIHEMNANNSKNLNYLINVYNETQKFRLCPAKIKVDEKMFLPCFDRGILKSKLFFRNAWEIDEDDLESLVIKKDDSPFIPNDVLDAPVLKVLKRKNLEN